MKAIKEAAIIGLIAILPASLAWARWQASSADLAPFEVVLGDSRIVQDEVLWLDARPRAEFEDSHITGAVLLNEQEWDSQLVHVFDVWQPETPIVVYCDAGCQSSEKVALRLRDMGVEPVYFLRGGYDAWKKSHDL